MHLTAPFVAPLAAPLTLAAGQGQGLRQVGELLLAFALSAAIGMERQLRGKSAGLRTQTIVGTSSALFLLISKYGFGDVLASGYVVLDPSRVAAQVVSGIGFLGAGLILTRGGAIRGLTTAAAVWETAAIGMAAGAGLPLLAGVVTALHFVTVIVFTWLVHRLPGAGGTAVRTRVSYLDRKGVLRELLARCTASGWTVTSLRAQDSTDGGAFGAQPRVTVTLGLATTTTRPPRPRPAADDLMRQVAEVPGVTGLELLDDEDFE